MADAPAPSPPPAALPPAPIICPECGTRSDVLFPALLRRRAAYLWLPRVILACLLVAGVVAAAQFPNTNTYPAMLTSWRPTESAEMTPAALARIARDGGDGSLVHALLDGRRESWSPSPDWHPCEPILNVVVRPKSGRIWSLRGFGWPTAWFTVDRETAFIDPDSETGPVPFDTGTHTMNWWDGSSTTGFSGGPIAPSCTRIEPNPTGIAMALVITLITGLIGRRLAERARRTTNPVSRRFHISGRRAFVLSATVAVLTLLGASALTTSANRLILRSNSPATIAAQDSPASSTLDLTSADIEKMRHDPVAEAGLAQHILSSLAMPAPGDNSVISMSLTCTHTMPSETVRQFGLPPVAPWLVVIQRDQPGSGLTDRTWHFSVDHLYVVFRKGARHRRGHHRNRP